MKREKENNKTYKNLGTSLCESSFSLFLEDVANYPLLSNNETEKLIKETLEGHSYARELLINSNLRLVVKIAKSFALNTTHMQLADLVNEGILGLIKAIDKYNPELGNFSSYISTGISWAINSSIKQKEKEIRIPAYVERATSEFLKLQKAYKSENKPLPDKKTICKILNITLEIFEKVELSLGINIISGDTPLNKDESLILNDMIATKEDNYENLLEVMEGQELLLILKEVLTPLEYFIAYNHYIKEKPLKITEIAKELGVTRQLIEQKEKRLRKKVQPYLKKESVLYKNAKQKIIRKYGKNFKILNTLPINPSDIVFFIYIKGYLTKLQITILKEMLFGKYMFNINALSIKLSISPEKIKEEISKIEKVKQITLTEKYEEIKRNFLQKYKTSIFKIDIDKELEIDYEYLTKKYGSLTIEELKELYGSRFNLLSKSSINLLERFLKKSPFILENIAEIERQINLIIHNYKKVDTNINKSLMYKTYLKNKELFNEEQQLYLECYYFNKKDKEEYNSKYPKKLIHRNELIDKLEKLTYNIHQYFYYSLTKEQYIKVRNEYKEEITPKRLELLDMLYGINEKAKSPKEIALILNKREDKVINQIIKAKEFCMSLYINRSAKNIIDKSLYIPYILKPKYTYTKDTKQVLTLYLLENKTYKEISKQLSISLAKVTALINNGLNRIDMYRFNIIVPYELNKDLLGEFYDFYKNKFTDIDKQIIELKYTKYLENEEIASTLKLDKLYINNKIKQFNKLLNNFKTKNVELPINYIEREINIHDTESVLLLEEKEVLSLFYGLKSNYNPESKKLSLQEICDLYKLKEHQFEYIYEKSILKLKLKLIGDLKPDLIYIKRTDLNKILDDAHLPISKEEYYIICSLLELKNHEYKDLTALSKELKIQESHLNKKYKDAIINIYKYLNKEIKGKINYDIDIIPNLKYFSNSDRLFINEYYNNNLSYTEIAKKYDMKATEVDTIFDRIHVNLYELINNPNCKKFDFDFYDKNKNNPNLPFYGDLYIAASSFELMTGHSTLKKQEAPEIIKRLNLNMKASSLGRVIYDLMISVCKLQNGIMKENTFSKIDALKYFEKNKHNMSAKHTRIYINYFNKIPSNKTTALSSYMKKEITCDLLEQNHPNYFRISTATKEDILNLLKKYSNKFTKKTRYSLIHLFNLGLETMSGKEKIKLYKILDLIDTHIKMEEENLKVQEQDETVLRLKNTNAV